MRTTSRPGSTVGSSGAELDAMLGSDAARALGKFGFKASDLGGGDFAYASPSEMVLVATPTDDGWRGPLALADAATVLVNQYAGPELLTLEFPSTRAIARSMERGISSEEAGRRLSRAELPTSSEPTMSVIAALDDLGFIHGEHGDAGSSFYMRAERGWQHGKPNGMLHVTQAGWPEAPRLMSDPVVLSIYSDIDTGTMDAALFFPSVRSLMDTASGAARRQGPWRRGGAW
jgi:hypothetical protein